MYKYRNICLNCVFFTTSVTKPFCSKRTEAAEIGILDIAGFENLQTNSFEQMCINMVNERLQYFMNNVVLIQEKRIYESEEIPFENVDFKDNMNIIQMFEISVNVFNCFWINVFELQKIDNVSVIFV